jgi:hypothetical protein
MLDFSITWLPIIGALVLGSAVTIWYGVGSKNVAIWTGFAGAIILALGFSLHLQKVVVDAETTKPGVDETEIKKARAYVFIDTIKTSNIDDNVFVVARDLHAHILVVVKNTGQTPAFKFTQQAAIRFAAWPPPENLFTLPKVAPGSRDTLPSGGFAQITAGLGRHLNIDEKTILGLGTHAVYLFGEIRYEDVFGIKRCTRYRYRVGGDVGFHSTAMVPMSEGNEVDQDCN